MQLDSVLVLVEAGKTVVGAGYYDWAQRAVVQSKKIADEIGRMYQDETDPPVPLVGLQLVEEMIGRKLLVGDLVVEVLAVWKGSVEEAKRHLENPLQEASRDLGAVLPVDLGYAYHVHHPVFWGSNLHLRPCDP